jgi:hypothetical protein
MLNISGPAWQSMNGCTDRGGTIFVFPDCLILKLSKEQNIFSKSYDVITVKRRNYQSYYYYSPTGILMATAEVYFGYMLHYKWS